MKKVSLIFVTALLLMCLGGCSGTKESEAVVTTASTESTTDATKSTNSYYITLKLESEAIAQNTVSESPEGCLYPYILRIECYINKCSCRYTRHLINLLLLL